MLIRGAALALATSTVLMCKLAADQSGQTLGTFIDIARRFVVRLRCIVRDR